MKIYLLRHTETKMNEEGKIQGKINTELSRKGMKEAEKIRDNLKDYDFDVCFSSPLIRAMQTAFTVVGDRVLILKDDRLIERDLGSYEGKDKKDNILDDYWDYNSNLSTNDVEPIRDVYQRIEAFLEDIKDDYQDKKVLIVSHGAIIRAFHNKFHNCIDNPDLIKIKNGYFEEVEL